MLTSNAEPIALGDQQRQLKGVSVGYKFCRGGKGYDTKAIRTIIRLRKKDANERIEEETILQTYMAALGME